MVCMCRFVGWLVDVFCWYVPVWNTDQKACDGSSGKYAELFKMWRTQLYTVYWYCTWKWTWNIRLVRPCFYLFYFYSFTFYGRPCDICSMASEMKREVNGNKQTTKTSKPNCEWCNDNVMQKKKITERTNKRAVAYKCNTKQNVQTHRDFYSQSNNERSEIRVENPMRLSTTQRTNIQIFTIYTLERYDRIMQKKGFWFWYEFIMPLLFNGNVQFYVCWIWWWRRCNMSVNVFVCIYKEVDTLPLPYL